MRVFNDQELRSIQRSINNEFSFTGSINPEEDRWREWYTLARDIEDFQTKKNKPFWDLRCPPEFGVEWKKHKCRFERPEDVLGKRVGHIGSRVVNLDGRQDREALADMRIVAEGYNALANEFLDHCGGEAYHGIVVHNDDAVIYYETRVKTIDTEGLRAEWQTHGDKTNLQVFNEAGQKVFTFLPNGNKISVVIPVPNTLEEVHYFKAENDVVFSPVEIGIYKAFKNRFPDMTVEDALGSML